MELQLGKLKDLILQTSGISVRVTFFISKAFVFGGRRLHTHIFSSDRCISSFGTGVMS